MIEESIWKIFSSSYLIIVLLWILLYFILKCHSIYENHIFNWYCGVSCFIYVIAFLYITLCARSEFSEMQYKLSFLWEYRALLDGETKWASQIMGNIVLFIPMGVLVSECKKTSLRSILIIGSFVSISTEFLQLFLRLGLFEFDDIFNNLLGMLCGYGLFKLANHIKFKRINEES